MVANPSGALDGRDETFSASEAPTVGGQFVSNVHSDSAELHGYVDPEGAETTYRFEYGPDTCSAGSCASTEAADVGSGLKPESESMRVTGLRAGTMYHYRIVATNQTETTYGPERTFMTFPFVDVLHDDCSNAHVRQQTGSALLPDCRAYELVSAANTGGYDVESDLVPGETPFGEFPDVESPSQVLYGVHDGGIPGTGYPTNRGVDPYLATRGANGWSTRYVGIPANGTPAGPPFSSPLAEADPGLNTFAFAGEGICSPCFGSGVETGIPLRLPNGSLVQGMAGPISPGPLAKPDGYVAKYFSANGEHFIFGSTSRFAEGGNEGADVSIYDHNLRTGETHVISNTPSSEDLPEALQCLQGEGDCNSAHKDSNGIAELDISADGSRVLIGQKVSEDSNGNVYWHLYMDINDSIHSIDLTPATSHGVLYDGMSSDGTRVYFTTIDKLTGEDEDESADIYRADVGESSATLHLVSTAASGPSNSDACDPVANQNGKHWNGLGAEEDCGAVAIGGGGGVAGKSGSIYFLSPELLAGESNGIANQPNLYFAAPGAGPTFIATLSPEDPVVVDAVKESASRRMADFQLSASGRFAVFTTFQPLSEYDNAGHSEIYRYEAGSGRLVCASCAPTNARATGDASMAQDGLSLTEDGRVFFNSTDALAPRDLDETEDAYEWQPISESSGPGTCQESSLTFSAVSGGCLGLISTGTSPFASSLLGVSANGVDAYFFTHDTLVPQDENGPLVKIYDARSEGGFPYEPPIPPCKASDECHGPGSAAPGPPELASRASSGAGNAARPQLAPCRKGFVKRHRSCVRRGHARKDHRKRHRGSRR